MRGLKYLFPGVPKIWAVIFILFFLSLSCQRGCRGRGCAGCNGCTTSVVVDEEVKKFKVDGIKVKLRANKNRVTNRKLLINRNISINKNTWYSVDYDLRVDNRLPLEHLCEIEADKNQELKQSIKQFKIAFSPDKQHFAVGVDDRVFEFFHFMPVGIPFSSGCYYLNDSSYYSMYTASIGFDNINWERFPSPDKLLDEIIVPNHYATYGYLHNRDNILKLLDELPPGNKHEIVLIDNWYCEMAYLHFTEKRVEAIVNASPKWLKTAKPKILKCIDNSFSDNDPELDASLNLALWLKDETLLNSTDSNAFADYFASGYVGDYFVERYKNRKTPIQPKIHQFLITEAKKQCRVIADFPEKMSLEVAVDILLINKEFGELKTFIGTNIEISKLENNFTKISFATINKYESYPQELKSLMVSKYHKVALSENSNLFAFDISKIVDFLKDKISCNELKKLVEMHKNELVGFIMPKGCR